MANNYLITGYWGEPHVTAENDRGIHAGIVGVGRFVLPVGQQFKAEYIGNNTVRLYDGKLVDNGAMAGIPAGEYIDLLIANASQNMKRNDLIVFQYEKDRSTLVESGRFVVLQGTEVSGTPSDPALTQGDLLNDSEVMFEQMPLWRVSVGGINISAPVQLFTVSRNLQGLNLATFGAAADNHQHGNIKNNGAIGSTANLPVFTGSNGVLGTKSAADARSALGLHAVAASGSYNDLKDKPSAQEITVDSALSDSSTNPVQNKVVKAALDGKAPSSHNQAASTITAGTLGGKVQANASAAATLTNPQVRDIVITTTDPGEGTSSSYPNGTVVFCP